MRFLQHALGRLAEQKRPCMGGWPVLFASGTRPPHTNTHPYSPAFEMCAWPPAFICHGLAISTTVEPKSLVCPPLSKFLWLHAICPNQVKPGRWYHRWELLHSTTSAYDTPLGDLVVPFV